ncbi:MAG: hypothetical protein EOO39_02245 [Cytophagaceae bacterium]|nr:MAG: hypothetical protein EOO39_02245 [Cytophagaceae bacterium]
MSQELPNASTARSLADQFNENKYNNERLTVINGIQAAIKLGQYQIEAKRLSPRLQADLQLMGYNIKDAHDGQDQMDYSIISW